MASCGGNDPCAPVNPCDCAETADIREQGPVGQRGQPGGTPTFALGSVTTGTVPSVTLTQLNPLQYQIDFVLPSASLADINIWTNTQTFDVSAVFSSGLQALGSSTFVNLTTTGAFISNGTSTFTGANAFSGPSTFTGAVSIQGGLTANAITVLGNLTLSGITELGAGECIKGRLFIDTCNNVRYVSGTLPNSASTSGSFSQSFTPGSTETALTTHLPFTIPQSCLCGTAMAVQALIFGIVQFNAAATVTAGAVDISSYTMRIRLDNALTGPLIYATLVNNLQSAANFYFEGLITPGAHTLYVTIQGNSAGTQGLTAAGLSVQIDS